MDPMKKTFEEHYDTAQLDLEIMEISQVIKLNPNYADAYNYRGSAYDNQKQYDLAIQDYSKAIQLNPNFAAAYNNRGITQKAQNKYELAIQDYSKAIELNPNYADAYNNRGNTYHAQNKYDLALQDYSKAIELNPKNAKAYYNIGITYKAQNKYELAIQYYSKAIELNPNYADAYNNRGITYQAQNKYDMAIQDYSKAIELNPKLADAYNNRGVTYQAQNKYDMAIQDQSKAIELNPNLAAAYNNRGSAYDDQNKYDLAIQDYSKAIELNPNYANAYYNRGITYQDQNKYDLAIQDYMKSIQLMPDHPLFLANLGAFLLFKNQHQEAQSYLLKAHYILNCFDEAALITKFSLSFGHMQFVKDKIHLLQEIDEKLQQLSNQAQELKKQNTLTPQQEKQIQQTQSKVANGLSFVSKKNEQDEINNLKHIIQLLAEELANFKINQNQVNHDLNVRQENFEKSDHYFIDKTLQEYKQPQNKNKQIYYRSFCQKLLTYIQACMLIETDLFNVNTDSALETNTEKLVNKINNWAQKASSLLTGLPVVGSVIEISLAIIDYGINCYKEERFKDKIKKITAVIKSKSGVSSDIEREVQIASFKIIDNITEEDLKFNNFIFQESVSQVLKEEESQKIEYVSNSYWKLGIDHSLRALQYIEQNSEAILTENLELRDIVLKSINNQGLQKQQPNQVKIVDNRDSSCCEIF